MNLPEKKFSDKSLAAQNEEKTLQFWRERNIFQKTLDKAAPQGDFIFFEGPPTANGKPGIHHIEARAFKDIIPRYKTMRGFRVARKGGWDTHGLPVELQVEKKLGLTSKKEIEEYGVEAFNAACKASVWEYLDLWGKFTDRIGYWVDQENPYVTYEKTYMESVWNILKTVSEKKVGGVLGIGGKEMLYKDYKVVPWCARCGTTLSSHELAQGYEDVKDLSVTVEFRVKGKTDTSLLAWTTTPWTLPGNVGLAVHPDIEYVEIEKKDMGEGALVRFILAKALLEKVFGTDEYTIVREMKGSELEGLEYEPLYPYLAQKFADKNPEAFSRAYKVYSADFVTTTDGTGIVHTAVMYGQEDFELGTKVGLPKFHLVKEDGHFLDDMGFLSGRFVKEKDEKGEDTLAIDIVKDLAGRGLLFKKEKYAHSYPHCWRCTTPLIYYARDSWYIRMSALRDELIAENKNINWEPEHFKEGRFGEWLREVKDWAISRERYWGTPLPFWANEQGKLYVIGSVAELKSYIKKRNRFTLIRHGESESNATGTINSDARAYDPLTLDGRKQVKDAARLLSKERIDYIITSPFPRAVETARIIAEELGCSESVITDDRLGELQVGAWNGKTWDEYEALFANLKERFTKHPHTQRGDGEMAENWEDARRRVAECMYDLDRQYEGKHILVVGHGGPLNLIALSSEGYSIDEIAEHYYDNSFSNAEIREIDWRSLPHNASYEIDLHRPFIDTIALVDEEGGPLSRVKEVLDVWFDSGAMPFAQHHYPFGTSHIPYPADYISEAVDQTRGWFYTLHAIGVLMGRGKAYNNVVCLGHILDAQGKKMSKSLGNVVDPWVMMDKYGVDPLRLWMYSVNRPGDSKNFDEQTVDEIVKKVFNLIANILSFYEMYALDEIEADSSSPHVLDVWICALFDEMVSKGTRALDNYNVFEPARAIRDFVGDFSTWYIRRSRDRFKSNDVEDKRRALQTTRYILLNLAKYMAPFTPFIAEDVYRRAGGPLESVHLEAWPEQSMKRVSDVVVLEDMKEVRDLVRQGLELRSRALVKVRQPLASCTIGESRIEGREDLIALVADELNVKNIFFDRAISSPMILDTTLTPELIEEGNYREFVRAVQDERKKQNLHPHDTVALFVSTNEAGRAFLDKYTSDLSAVSLLDRIEYVSVTGQTLSFGDYSFTFRVEKV